MAGIGQFHHRASGILRTARGGLLCGNFGVNQQSFDAGCALHGRFDEELSAARDFSSGFIPDRDYRSETLFSNTGVQTSLGRTLIMLGAGDKPFGANQFYGNFDSWERTKSMVRRDQAGSWRQNRIRFRLSQAH